MPNLRTTIPVDDWNVIVKQIHKQRCVPFLGAGVNIKCGEEDSLPLGADVALRLLGRMISRPDEISDSYRINWKNLKEYRTDIRKALTTFATVAAKGHATLDEALLDNLLKSLLQILPDEQTKLAHIIVDESLDQYQDLTRVALQDLARVSLRYRRNKNLPDFIDELKEIIPDTKRNVPRLLRVLANMPFRLIVTTNYDRLMERSLELFSESALARPNELTDKVKSDKALPSRVLRDLIPDQIYEMLKRFDSANPSVCIPAFVWINELNVLIQEKSLYILENEQPSDDDLSPEFWARLYKRPETVDLVQRNRVFLERSYPDILKPHNKAYKPIVQPINGFKGPEENRIQTMLSEHDGLVLYKLHGTFTDGEPREETRPVITEEDYIEFLTYVGPEGEKIDKQITARIKTSTLLFLGYSLEDWNFRALFKGLVEKVDLSYRPFSYAIQKDPSEFWVRFWEGSNRNVHIFNMDMCEFTDELESRYRAYVRQIENVEKNEQKVAMELDARRKARRDASGRL
jgi:hypothetical protein